MNENSKLAKLVDDLFWEQDRMSGDGVKTLNDLADFVEDIQGLIMHDHYYNKQKEKNEITS